MICVTNTETIKLHLDEYVFDGQFIGLQSTEKIIEKYLDLITQDNARSAWVSRGERSFLCVLNPQLWDSKQLQKRVGRIDYISNNCKEKVQFKDIHSCLKSFDLVYLRLSHHHPLYNLIKEERFGFHAFAEKIMFRMKVVESNSGHDNSKIREYHDIEASDKEDQLLRIAQNAFTRNRFARDKNLPVDFAKNVYKSWLRNCLSGDKLILCSLSKNKILGFIIISDTKDTTLECFNCGFTELIAVDESVKRKSVGTELLCKARQILFEKNIKTLHANTDSKNSNAIKFFITSGFQQFNLIREYHWWRI